LLVIGVTVGACGGGDSDSGDPTPSRDDVVAAITTEVIVPGYERLAAATAALQAALDDLCAHQDDDRLAVAQQAWRDARQAWAATRPYRLGPATERRAMSKVDFPIDATKITLLLTGTDPVDAAAVASLGSDQRGLGGIEVALFGDDPTGARPCAYAASASELVAATAATLLEDWETGVDADAQQVVEELVNGTVFALGEMADMRLGPASGSTTGAATPADVDAGPAHSALDDMLAVLDGVDEVVDGLDPLISAQSAETAERLATQLAKARANIGLIPAPLATATDVEAMASAYRSTAAALTIARAEVASLLGVTLTLGDADGDG
jgi:predicted lipoprotein